MSSDLKKFAEQLVNLSIKEVNELAAILKEEHGIEPAVATPVMMAGAGAQGTAGGPAVAAEKTHYDVVLKSAGPSKLAVVKVVKDLPELAPLGIKEAKDLVDAAPKTLKEGVAKAAAEDMKSKLETAGAEVELK